MIVGYPEIAIRSYIVNIDGFLGYVATDLINHNLSLYAGLMPLIVFNLLACPLYLHCNLYPVRLLYELHGQQGAQIKIPDTLLEYSRILM